MKYNATKWMKNVNIFNNFFPTSRKTMWTFTMNTEHTLLCCWHFHMLKMRYYRFKLIKNEMQIEKIKKTLLEYPSMWWHTNRMSWRDRERVRNAVCRMLIVRSIFVIRFTQTILVSKLFPIISSFIVPFDLPKCRSSSMLFLIHYDELLFIRIMRSIYYSRVGT